jgi:hypothetical protein
MKNNPFQTLSPKVTGNDLLREPQQQVFAELIAYAADGTRIEREAGIVLPVGCGKSGCIALTPFAFKSNRTLVVAPNVLPNLKSHCGADMKCTISKVPGPLPLSLLTVRWQHVTFFWIDSGFDLETARATGGIRISGGYRFDYVSAPAEDMMKASYVAALHVLSALKSARPD